METARGLLLHSWRKMAVLLACVENVHIACPPRVTHTFVNPRTLVALYSKLVRLRQGSKYARTSSMRAPYTHTSIYAKIHDPNTSTPCARNGWLRRPHVAFPIKIRLKKITCIQIRKIFRNHDHHTTAAYRFNNHIL